MPPPFALVPHLVDPRGRVLELAADFAVRAPSVHGSRPWRMELQPARMVIRADRSRQLTAFDPKGRELVESVGAALFNVRVALAHGGWAAAVARLPRPDDPDLLAEVRPVPGDPDPALAALAPVARRGRTNRRRFTGAQVPDAVLRRLTEIAEREAVLLVPVVHEVHRRLVARLTREAYGLQNTDVPPEPASDDAHTMVLIATRTDDELAWLRSGEALQHALLEVTRLGWAAAPLPWTIEVPLTRTQLRAALTWDAHPQMLVRISRAVPDPSAHRPVSGGARRGA